MTRAGASRPARLVGRARRRAVLVVALATVFTTRPTPADAATILVGQNWLGVWRDGRVVASRDAPGWQFDASRIGADGRTVEVAAYRVARPDDPVKVLVFDALTLVRRGRRTDATLARMSAATPIGTDPDFPDAVAPNGPMVARRESSAILVRPRGAPEAAAFRLPAGEWRVAMAPDGSVAAAFARPRSGAGPWVGTAWDVRTGHAIVAPGLTIDDGSARENGAARALACLLPRGEGAIFTDIGAPADRVSRFQRFGAGPPAAPRELRTPYVMSCLATPER